MSRFHINLVIGNGDKSLYFSQHVYMGSANLGNRGTRRTKELGIVVKNCPKLAEDATKMISLYWSLYKLKKLPE